MARAPRSAPPPRNTRGAPPPAPSRSPETSIIGTDGKKVYGGIINEELLPQLQGVRGQRAYRDMADNDPTIGACLSAVGLVLRAVTWTCERNPEAEEGAGEAEAEFALGLFDDMSHTFEDLVDEVLSMMVYGWHWAEVVLKRRIGPLERDPKRRSKYTDGRIGIRKMAPRPQDTLDRWEFDADGGTRGMYQRDMSIQSQLVFIPIERSLLFRTVARKNNPEGRSMLRNCYRPHYFHKRIQEYEAVGVERELAGLPVVSIPMSVINGTDAANTAAKNTWTKVARDLKFNEQGGLLKPSNVYLDSEGKPTANEMYKIELLKAGGPRAIDTDKIKTGYQRDMARAFLADFLMLGTDKGAYNLSESKQSLFLRCCDALLWRIAAPINRYLLPRIWDYNGLDRGLLPTMKPGRLNPVDMQQLGDFLTKLATAGDTPFPDEEFSDWVRDEVGMPHKSQEAIALQDQEREAMQDALMGGGGGQQPADGNEPPPQPDDEEDEEE